MSAVSRRRFDHDEARRLRASGLSYDQIARRLGVSKPSVWQAINGLTPEQRKRRNEAHRRKNTRPCRGGCGRRVWAERGLCPACLAASRFVDGRPRELRCTICREWKPDEDFARDSLAVLRRGRKGECRACISAANAARYRRKKVPCVNCGRPRAAKTTTGLCARCYWRRAQPPLLLGPPEPLLLLGPPEPNLNQKEER